MNWKRNHTLVASFILSGLVLLALGRVTPHVQSQQTKQTESWQSKLYERDVKYEASVCSKEDFQIVAKFFNEHPLNRLLPICHNDCPIIKCRPVIPLTEIVKSAKVTGTVSVHVLVDESGKVLYARVLSGNPILWPSARKGACETQFKEYSHHKHQGVMHFTVDDPEYLTVPNRANRVR